VQAVLEAVVEPRRREILRLVRTRFQTAGAIAAHFPDVSRPSVSQHLRVLRDAGLLHERREGTRRFYRARIEGFAELQTFIEEFWDSRLQTLKVEAEHEQRRQDVDRNK
jgi:DNA-binding transcriptional ArsR family regulator